MLQEGTEGDQIGALGLVLNALVLFNTRYMDAAVTQLREDGLDIRDEDVARLSSFVGHPVNDRAPRRSADGGNRGAAVLAVAPDSRCSSGCLRMGGVCRPFEAAQTTIDTNLVGTTRVIDAFTPHLVQRGAGTFITVTSGVAFLPFPPMPTYAASKAAVHAYSEALRAQPDGTGVSVVELVPSAVATAGQEKVNPQALPLDDFAAEVMQLLSQNPTPDEILVERVLTHRWAERDGTYDDLVAKRAQALAMLPSRQG